MRPIVIDGSAPPYAHDLVKQIEDAFRQPVVLPNFSKDTLPKTAQPGQLIRVSDATSGEAIAMWDGSAWLEYPNTGVVS